MKRAMVLLLTGLLALPLAGAPPATAEGGDVAVARGLSLTPSTLTVPSTLGYARASVTVSIDSSPPVAACTGGAQLGGGQVVAHLWRVGSLLDTVDVVLERTAGDASSGTWTGSWRVGSGRVGTWRLTQLLWCVGRSAPEGSPVLSVPTTRLPGGSPQVVVSAVNGVRVTNHRVPAVAAYYGAQWEHLTYTDSAGRPLAGRTVAVGSADTCGSRQEGDHAVTLDRTGSAWVRLAGYAQCAMLVVPPTSTVTAGTTVVAKTWLHRRLMSYRSVRAVRVSATFRVGTAARVNVAVSPAVGEVALQVLQGRTWRTLTLHRVVPGIFVVRVPTTAPAKLVRGTHLYRVAVVVPGTLFLAKTASASFRMTGR